MGVFDNKTMYENYVTIAAKFARITDSVEGMWEDSFADDPDRRIQAYFWWGPGMTGSHVFGRTGLVDMVAEDLPEFSSCAQAINSHGFATIEQLSDEYNLLLPYWNKPEFSQNYKYVALIAAYSWILCYDSEDSQDSGTQPILNIMLNELNNSEPEEDGEFHGAANTAVTVVLWFSDYNGFRQKVLDKVQELNENEDKDNQERREDRDYLNLQVTDPSNLTKWKGTNGESIFIESIQDPDTSWFTQANAPITKFADFSQSVFGDYKALGLSAEVLNTISETMDTLSACARETAAKCKRAFNVSALITEEEEVITYEDVPKVVKTGLFKKETRYERVERKTMKSVTKEVYFKGWLLEHFYRKSESQYVTEYMNWDYCLGADGNVYLLNSYGQLRPDQNNLESYYNCGYRIYKCIPLTPLLITAANADILIALISSFTGVLDYVAPGGMPERKTLVHEELYHWNYPVTTNRVPKENVYPFGRGLKMRLDSLL